jgi:DNA helicase IV
VQAPHGTTAAARERFRMALVRRFYADYAHVHGGAAVLDGEQIEQALRRSGALRAVLDRAWPPLLPQKLVRALFTTPAFLAEAAEGILAPEEQRLLRRRGTAWSDADVALLDEAHTLVGTPPRTFGHVVVDEAQDLTPMQLRMVGRRARGGALTILGDVAQATGPVGYDSWDAVLPFLPHGDEAAVEELRHAYRVPREIMELALPLLPAIAPSLVPPLAYRTGAAPPTVREVPEAELMTEAYREARRLAAEAGLLALIVPDELLPAGRELRLEPESAFEGIPLLTPRAAKGLEFDHVIVVEPALIAARPQGLRELYVALTRPTKTLVVLHARPLPPELGRQT